MSATIFKAIVWKELRENVNWGALVMICMSTVLAVLIPSQVDLLRGQGVDLATIGGVLDQTSRFGGLLAGLLFGVMQTVGENRGDRWGFLAHRPATRTTLFWGKATAGILLYAISTGVPVLAALLWISTPDRLPLPVDWRIALPAIANLLCGVVFYFAGFLTGMRQARWYASRTLGIGAAICCLMLGLLAIEFWQAVAICAAGLILVGTAAWSSFVAGGQYVGQTRIGLLATGVSIGLSMILVGLLVLLISLQALPQSDNSRFFRGADLLLVTNEGVVARATPSVKGEKIGDRTVETSYPDGRPMDQRLNSQGGQYLGNDGLTATLRSRQWTPPSFRSTSRLLSELRRARHPNPIGWYYVHRLGLIAAYDSESGKLIGWMGPDGFSSVDVKPRSFSGRAVVWSLFDRVHYFLVLEDAVYRIDLDDRRVEKAFQADPAEAILAVGRAYNRASTITDYGETAQFEVIWTTRRVILQLRDGTRLLAAPAHAKAREFPIMQVTRALWAPGDPTFIWYGSNYVLGEGFLSEFDSAGRVVNSWTLPAPQREWKDTLPRIAVASALFPLNSLYTAEQMNIAEQLSRFRLYPPISPGTAALAVALLSSLISAAAAFLHGRRYAFPPGRLSVWTAFALLLGPLGYLTMLALIEWPAREPCPACSRKRVVTLERCEHCGAPFAAPPQDGTEIFEPAGGT